MTPSENTQHASPAGRRTLDAILITLVVGVPALIGAGALGLFG